MLTCVELNSCTRACTDATCVEACRVRATPSAIDKESALQTCFSSSCPQSNATGDAVCMQSPSGTFSTDCVRCIENTQVARNLDCSPPEAPECHACLTQYDLCSAD